MTIQVGQRAPDFKGQAVLPDGSFKEIKLADYKGKWVVLFFYPLDFTFVCPTDPEGVISSSVVNITKVGRSVDETFRTLQALQAGELMPCDWKPGQKTLGK
ncbi:MAG: redoxin domain-containing protein [Nitrospinae bacterium]|nr:redoxin domain-containing protein [Nitrospinota bacterium]